MEDEAYLFDWLKHYARLFIGFALLGAVIAGVVVSLKPIQYEAATVVLRKGEGEGIPDRSLGSVVSVLSGSPAVYGLAAERLTIEGSPRTFFRRHSEVRPVPGSNVMLVIGRSSDSEEAADISYQLARAIPEALEERAGFSGLTVFDRPRSIRSIRGFSLPVTVALGGVAGLFAGLAASVALYRRRRPVLTVWRAAYLCGTNRIALMDARRPWWRRLFRSPLVLGDTARNRATLLRLNTAATWARHLERPTGGWWAPSRSNGEAQIVASPKGIRLSRSLRTALNVDSTRSDGPSAGRIVLAHEGMLERDLLLARLDPTSAGKSLELLWIR